MIKTVSISIVFSLLVTGVIYLLKFYYGIEIYPNCVDFPCDSLRTDGIKPLILRLNLVSVFITTYAITFLTLFVLTGRGNKNKRVKS